MAIFIFLTFSVAEFDLVCGKTWLAALISASVYIGGVLGSIVTGPLSDR